MQIKVYTTTTCPYCRMEKEFLDSKRVKYENIFIDQNPEKVEEMMKISGQMGVPFTVITKDDNAVVTVLGFDKEKISQELGLQ